MPLVQEQRKLEGPVRPASETLRAGSEARSIVRIEGTLMQERHFARGQYVFRQGDPSDFAYILASGSVEIVTGASGGEVRLAVMREGDIFGEMGVIDEAPRSASARALEPVLATAVACEEFVHTVLHHEEQGLALLRALFERLRVTNQLLLRTIEGRGQPTSPPREEALEAAPQLGSDYRLTLRPLTPETQAALPAEGIRIDRVPVRIGRRAQSLESSVLAFNEVELRDTEPFQVSLNHLAIDLERGRPVVRDRGSRNGTGVNGQRIGGDALRMIAPLVEGDNEIVLGPPTSPFRLSVVLATDGA